MNLQDIERSLQSFIYESFLSDAPHDALDRETDLFQTLDSLQILRMVLHIEQQFGVAVVDGDLSEENLGSLAKAAAFVEKKRQAAYSSSSETSREPGQPVET